MARSAARTASMNSSTALRNSCSASPPGQRDRPQRRRDQVGRKPRRGHPVDDLLRQGQGRLPGRKSLDTGLRIGAFGGLALLPLGQLILQGDLLAGQDGGNPVASLRTSASATSSMLNE